MKVNSTIYPVLLAGLLLPLIFSCKKQALPTVTITAVTNITANSATSGGEIITDGGASVTGRGVCWSTNQNPTTADSKTTDGTGKGSFSSSITELTPGATYNLKAYAINAVGTAYSSPISFSTLALAPVIITTYASAVTSSSVNSGGNITNDGGSPVTARGVCWGTILNPTIADSKTTDGTGLGIFTSVITGLTPGSIYYIRAYATNNLGTTYGTQVTFTTSVVEPVVPTLTTSAASSITSTTATSGGNISSDGGDAVTTRGICWSTSSNPTISNSKTTNGTGTGSFISYITGLTANTTYYVRAYATNSAGTAYGSQISFITQLIFHGTVSDVDGNTYSTVTIGNQEWMAKNLKTTKYNDGTSIPLEIGSIEWGALITPGYCWYDNSMLTYGTYGVLYNWYTVNTGKLCPIGWHVPSDAEWTTLTTFLGGDNVAGGKLKATSQWNSPNTGATNETGFSALPGGLRYYGGGTFSSVGFDGNWWSSTGTTTPFAWPRGMSYNISNVYSPNFSKRSGFSVRCLRD